MLHSGYMLKLGEGPINYDWNNRFLVLDIPNRELSYYKNDRDTKSRGVISLKNSFVSNIGELKGQEYTFCIMTQPPSGKTIYLANVSPEQCIEWRNKIIQTASGKGFINRNSISNPFIAAGPDKPVLRQTTGATGLIGGAGSGIVGGAGASSSIMNQSHVEERKDSMALALGMSPLQQSQIIPAPSSAPYEEQKVSPLRQPSREVKSQLEAVTPSARVETERAHVPSSRGTSNMPYAFKFLVSKVRDEVKAPDKDEPLKTRYAYIKNGTFVVATESSSYRKLPYRKIVGVAALTLLVLVVVNYFSLPGFVQGLISTLAGAVCLMKERKLWESQRRYANIKGVAKVNMSVEETVLFLKEHARKYDSMVYTVKNFKRVSEYFATYESDYVLESEQGRLIREFELKDYWLIDEDGNAFFLSQANLKEAEQVNAKPAGNGDDEDDEENDMSDLVECFAVHPISATQSFLTFTSAVNLGKGILTPREADAMQLERASWLSGVKTQIDLFFKGKELKSSSIVRASGIPVSDLNFHQSSDSLNRAKETSYPLAQRFESVDTMAGGGVGSGTTPLMGSSQSLHGARFRNFKITKFTINPANFYWQTSDTSIAGKFPGYERNERGLLICKNNTELETQSGVMVKIVKSAASKNIFEGKDIVSVSLPIEVSEPRSLLERFTDMWGSCTHFLSLAGSASDPLQKLKYVMCFAISGIHMGSVQQMKPFNPILGETYEGYWPDGSQVYMQQTSHRPPTTHFEIQHPSNLFHISGYYEFTASLCDFGNGVEGRASGPNRVLFKDGTLIEFWFPQVKISGLLFGERAIKVVGNMDFVDAGNHLYGSISFDDTDGIFSLKRKDYDIFIGEIRQNRDKVCHVQGSWLSHCEFDGVNYWEIEKSDMIKPQPVDICLPSDCRYRPDIINLIHGNRVRAQEEKQKLEEQQRADLALRQQRG